MKKITSTALLLVMLSGVLFCQAPVENQPDPRDKYIGDYNITLYYHYRFMLSDFIYDTLSTNLSVKKLVVDTTINGTYLSGTDKRLVILVDTIPGPTYIHWCTQYLPEKYIYPMIDSSGELSYPELNNCQGSLRGHLRKDSISFTYGFADHMEAKRYTMIGKKDLSSSRGIFLTNRIDIYPNPVETIINISEYYLKKFTTIEIIDIGGKQVLKRQLDRNQIDVTNLKPSIYFIILSNKVEKGISKFLKK
ncbi:MAG: T9SS type A sorting domain-containing protein [Bacteroidales bacterium]|jgi:hypothetical protein